MVTRYIHGIYEPAGGGNGVDADAILDAEWTEDQLSAAVRSRIDRTEGLEVGSGTMNCIDTGTHIEYDGIPGQILGSLSGATGIEPAQADVVKSNGTLNLILPGLASHYSNTVLDVNSNFLHLSTFSNADNDGVNNRTTLTFAGNHTGWLVAGANSYRLIKPIGLSSDTESGLMTSEQFDKLAAAYDATALGSPQDDGTFPVYLGGRFVGGELVGATQKASGDLDLDAHIEELANNAAHAPAINNLEELLEENVTYVALGSDRDAGGTGNTLNLPFTDGGHNFTVRRILDTHDEAKIIIDLSNFTDSQFSLLADTNFTLEDGGHVYSFGNHGFEEDYASSEDTREIEFTRHGPQLTTGTHKLRIFKSLSSVNYVSSDIKTVLYASLPDDAKFAVQRAPGEELEGVEKQDMAASLGGSGGGGLNQDAVNGLIHAYTQPYTLAEKEGNEAFRTRGWVTVGSVAAGVAAEPSSSEITGYDYATSQTTAAALSNVYVPILLSAAEVTRRNATPNNFRLSVRQDTGQVLETHVSGIWTHVTGNYYLVPAVNIAESAVYQVEEFDDVELVRGKYNRVQWRAELGITGASLESLADREVGPGLDISGSVTRYSGQLFTPAFDLDDVDNGDGTFEPEITIILGGTIVGTTVSFIPATTEEEAGDNRSARIFSFVRASTLRASTVSNGADGNGVLMGRRSVYSSGNIVWTISAYLFRDGNNQVGISLIGEQEAGTISASLSSNMSCEFQHQDGGGIYAGPTFSKHTWTGNVTVPIGSAINTFGAWTPLQTLTLGAGKHTIHFHLYDAAAAGRIAFGALGLRFRRTRGSSTITLDEKPPEVKNFRAGQISNVHRHWELIENVDVVAGDTYTLEARFTSDSLSNLPGATFNAADQSVDITSY